MKKKYINMLIITLFFGFFLTDYVYASCPLGEHVTKDIASAFRILRVLAPLLVIGFSTYEAVVAITKGNSQNELKTVAQRFLKRLLYAIILFFLIIIVDAVMSFTGLVNEDECELQEKITNGVE